MSNDKVSRTTDIIDQLLISKIGDSGRLSAIKNALENGRTVYDSDKEYLKKKYDEFLENTSEQRKLQEITQKKRNEKTALIKKRQNDLDELRDKTAKLEEELEELKKDDDEDIASKDAMTPIVEPVSKLSSKLIIKPRVSAADVITYSKVESEKNSKGGFLGKGKIVETPIAWELFYYPFYDVEIEATIQVTEKRGWFKKETVPQSLRSRTGVDARHGEIIDVHNGGISYDYAFLAGLSDEEVFFLYYVSSVNEFTIATLRGLGWSDSKARRIADGLSANGILTKYSGRPAKYKTKYPYPKNPANFISILEHYKPEKTTINVRVLEPTLNSNSLNLYVSRYWSRCSIISSECVFYPFYGLVYQRENHTRTEIIDGVTGTPQKYLERRVSVQPVNKIN